MRSCERIDASRHPKGKAGDPPGPRRRPPPPSGGERVLMIPFALLAVHFVADFVLQSDWMALNKSKRWDALALHCAVYAACFLWWGLTFALVTFAAHFVQDAITSRINARLWQANERHWFFVAIGADQLLHYAQLGLTLRLLS